MILGHKFSLATVPLASCSPFPCHLMRNRLFSHNAAAHHWSTTQRASLAVASDIFTSSIVVVTGNYVAEEYRGNMCVTKLYGAQDDQPKVMNFLLKLVSRTYCICIITRRPSIKWTSAHNY
jgi:hypothetical protein